MENLDRSVMQEIHKAWCKNNRDIPFVQFLEKEKNNPNYYKETLKFSSHPPKNTERE